MSDGEERAVDKQNIVVNYTAFRWFEKRAGKIRSSVFATFALAGSGFVDFNDYSDFLSAWRRSAERLSDGGKRNVFGKKGAN
jgi:hypothetical protein